MTTDPSGLATPIQMGPSVESAPLVASLETGFLELLGWSWQYRIASFPAAHPLLGWVRCRVTDCDNAASSRSGLCSTCGQRWKASGTVDIDTYLVSATRLSRGIGVVECGLAGCERPRVGELCDVHRMQCLRKNLSVEEFIRDPGVVPLKRRGICMVAACPRDRDGVRFCSAHRRNRTRELRRDPDGFDEERWIRTAPAILDDNVISLLGLNDLVVVELLLGLQRRTERGRKTSVSSFRALSEGLRGCDAESVRDLLPDRLSKHVLDVHSTFIDVLERHEASPLSNFSTDRWALEAVGHSGFIDFTGIRQKWLREATKRWAFDELPRRNGRHTASAVRRGVAAIERLAASLARHRHDHGQDPRSLSRMDVTELLNWLAHLENTGYLSRFTRRRRCLDLSRILLRMRSMGLTRPGEPLEGLSDEVAVGRADVPARPDDDEAGRDLPLDIVTALIEHLPKLGTPDDAIRIAVELLIATGRRPGEIAQLPLDCLGEDSDAKPVLIWDNHKGGRLGRRLPITATTAQTIIEQQDRVRGRHPSTPAERLPLLPAGTINPTGTRSISVNWLGDRHRDWLDALPELTAPVMVEDDGHSTVRHRPFDLKQVSLYSWRHTYCQRHADAGVAPDVLRDLMDHRSMSTTQGYYRVSESRRRDAVDRVTAMQFDRHGDRVWRHAEGLLDSERARRRLGEVAVPYGLCTEPSNVAAGGNDCPVRFRCVGCNHFRTDVSYLPDLEGYLADLLRHRERLRAATDVADSWAIDEATPSDEEIARIRTLIRRIKHEVDDLDSDARAEIEAAVSAVRRSRNGAVGLGMPRVRPEPLNLRPERTA